MVYLKTYEFAFKKGYGEGYSEGYEKGHSEGYSEGWKLSEEHNKQIKNTLKAINDWEKNNLSSY
jgi:flagellar biosynthesis/type III secretory pathway protein FliH